MIVFCGYANLDVVGRVPRLPAPHERVHAASVELMPGGMGANASVAAARACAGSGSEVAFAGVVGTDPLSDGFLGQLSAEGVDATWSARTASLSTAIVLVDAEGQRAVISEDDAVDDAHVAAVADRLEQVGGGLLYLDGYRASSVATAGRPGVVVAIDLDGCDDPELALAAIAQADHVLVGRLRLEELLAVPAATWPDLARAGRTHLLVTDGPRGWQLARPDGSQISGEALAVDVVDDTGAGDCFAGTYLAGLAVGLLPDAAASRAGVAASLSCTVPGARAAPAPEVVDAHLDLLDHRSQPAPAGGTR